MKIEDVRLGMPLVTTGGLHGQVVAIEREGGLWLETADRTRFPVHAECVERVDSPCEGCQMQDDRDFWKTTALQYQEQAHYWMQEWVDREMKPIAEVAKCYKQVEPDQLLLSTEARRVVEYLKARDCPISIHHIFESMTNIMSGMAIMDGLIEARDAGIVRLDDGKYSIVRETC
jgi:hypothetical protein